MTLILQNSGTAIKSAISKFWDLIWTGNNEIICIQLIKSLKFFLWGFLQNKSSGPVSNWTSPAAISRSPRIRGWNYERNKLTKITPRQIVNLSKWSKDTGSSWLIVNRLWSRCRFFFRFSVCKNAEILSSRI